MISNNEKKVLRLLLSSVTQIYSINQISKECTLSPNGAYKILKKFEKENVLVSNIVINSKSYRINFNNEKTILYLELALTDEFEKKIKFRYEDFKSLKDTSKVCILFGSYAKKDSPNDLDIFFIIGKNEFNTYKKSLELVKELTPVKIHDVIQTSDDFKKNILTDKVLISIIREGVVLWGQKIIIEMIKDVYKN